jgi:hypothetical protein
LKKKFEKEKKRKTSPFSPFGPNGPAAHHPSPRTGPRPLSFSFSFALTDAWAPLVGLPPFPFLSSFVCPAGLPPQPLGSRRAPPSPLPFSPHQACQLRQLIVLVQVGPFPLSLHRAVMAAAINGKRRRSEPARLPSPSSLRSYLSTHSIACASLCLPSTPTRLLEPQFPSAAASGSRRRRANVAVGEGPPPPPFSLSLWVHQGLIKLNWLQVPILGARGCRASSTLERRPSCRRCKAPPLLNPLHLRARPLHP